MGSVYKFIRIPSPLFRVLYLQVGADVWAQWENEGLVVEDGWNDSDMAVRE